MPHLLMQTSIIKPRFAIGIVPSWRERDKGANWRKRIVLRDCVRPALFCLSPALCPRPGWLFISPYVVAVCRAVVSAASFLRRRHHQKISRRVHTIRRLACAKIWTLSTSSRNRDCSGYLAGWSPEGPGFAHLWLKTAVPEQYMYLKVVVNVIVVLRSMYMDEVQTCTCSTHNVPRPPFSVEALRGGVQACRKLGGPCHQKRKARRRGKALFMKYPLFPLPPPSLPFQRPALSHLRFPSCKAAIWRGKG